MHPQLTGSGNQNTTSNEWLMFEAMKRHRVIDGVNQKKCKRCQQWLPLSQFYRDSKSIDGLFSYCKVCSKENQKDYREKVEKRRAKVATGTKVCSKCGRVLPISEFSRHRSTKDGYQPHCKACHRQISAQLRQEQKEKMAEEKAKIVEKPTKAISSRLARATDIERCSNCKSWSSCGHGNGYCMRLKSSCHHYNVCADHTPNYKTEFAQEAKQVAIYNSTPYS